MSSDVDILKVLLQIENPQVLNQIEQFKKGFHVKLTADLDQGLKEVLSISGKTIKINADATQALNTLKGIQTTLESFGNLKPINLRLSGDISRDIAAVQRQVNELRASLVLPELAQLGAIQNKNIKTLANADASPGGKLDQAEAIRNINNRLERDNAQLRAELAKASSRPQVYIDRNAPVGPDGKPTYVTKYAPTQQVTTVSSAVGQGVSESVRRARLAEEQALEERIKGKPLGGLGTNARKPSKFFDKV